MIPDAMAAGVHDLLVGLGVALAIAVVVFALTKNEEDNESMEITVQNTKEPDFNWPPKGKERVGYSPRRYR